MSIVINIDKDSYSLHFPLHLLDLERIRLTHQVLPLRLRPSKGWGAEQQYPRKVDQRRAFTKEILPAHLQLVTKLMAIKSCASFLND